MVSSAAVHGTFGTNPLTFQDFKMTQINIKVNGATASEHTVDMDVGTNRSVLGYLSLFENLGLNNCDSGIDIKLDEYRNGKVLHVFNLLQTRDTYCLPKFGNVAISLRFKEATEESITVIVFCEYQSIMYINSDRQIFFKDYTKE
jgi:hypothetical protein